MSLESVQRQAFVGKALQKLGLKELQVKVLNELDEELKVTYGILPRPKGLDISGWWQVSRVAPGTKLRINCDEEGAVVNVEVTRPDGCFRPYINRQLNAKSGYRLTVRKEKLAPECWHPFESVSPPGTTQGKVDNLQQPGNANNQVQSTVPSPDQLQAMIKEQACPGCLKPVYSNEVRHVS
jgi:hypothetical protein